MYDLFGQMVRRAILVNILGLAITGGAMAAGSDKTVRIGTVPLLEVFRRYCLELRRPEYFTRSTLVHYTLHTRPKRSKHALRCHRPHVAWNCFWFDTDLGV